jgi:hypothetical protein
MSQQDSSRSKGSHKVKIYVGTYLPLTLYRRLVEEGKQAGIPRSEVLRRALAERYGEPSQQEAQGKRLDTEGGEVER